ncbi:MAG: LamG-like jellyroll fold domain-containing protein [Syntrophobacteraceae bacterium]
MKRRRGAVVVLVAGKAGDPFDVGAHPGSHGCVTGSTTCSSLFTPHSSLSYTVIEVRNPFAPQENSRESRPWFPGITLQDISRTSTISGPVWVTLNGADPTLFTPHSSLFTQHVCPGDFIYIWPRVHGPIAAIIPFVAGLAFKAAVGASLFATIGAAVITIAGGFIINSLMSNTPDANKAGPEKSPTYGFDNANPSKEGFPAPVYYGETIVTPAKLGEYLTTEKDSSQTYHGLFAVGQGKADRLIRAEDVLINDEPLISYKNFSISSTIGDNSPPSDSFPGFMKLHQYRSFARPLDAASVHLEALLHFNGDDGATLLIDETANHTWVCQGNAALSTTDPFAGSACLDCPDTDDFVSTASPVYSWNSSATIEFRARIADLDPHGFMGGEFSSGGVAAGWWGLVYRDGMIVFQMIGQTYDYELGAYSCYTICEMSAAVSLAANTWLHFCLQRNGPDIRLYLDGVHIASCSGAGGWGGVPATTIGLAKLLEAGSASAFHGRCKIDELRILTGRIVYGWDGFTPPAEELSELQFETAETLSTLNVVDSCRVVLGALRGLYWMSGSGEKNPFTVRFELAYRRVGQDSWTTSEVTLTDASLQEVRRQFSLSFPARARYEIRVKRITAANDATNTQNETTWIGIDEILNEHLLYPNFQVLELNIRADERLRGTVPAIRVVGKRTLIEVPAYNGLSVRQVDAANPAWAAYDILTNDLYGAAVKPAARIDSLSHEEWVEWCDGMVAGNKRARFNGVFDTEGNIQQALRYVYDVGRVGEITMGQKIAWAIEKPGRAKHQFTTANTQPESHALTFLPRTERVDVVIVEFTDRDKRWKRSSISIPSSGFAVLSAPARTQKIFLRGCNNREQARREGILKMQMTERLNRTVSFRAGLEAVTCLPGHIAHFQHGGNRIFFGGRVRSLSGRQIVLDRIICLDSETFEDNARIWIRTCEDVLLSADIDGPFNTGTNSFILHEALSGGNADAPDSFDPYMLGRHTNEVYACRILDVSPPGQDLKSTVQAIEYNESVYFHPDYESGQVAI